MAPMEQSEHKVLDLSKRSFESLIQQLPATFPADWGQRADPFKARNVSNLPLILHWDGHQLLVQITGSSWIADLKANCDSVWSKEAENCQYTLRLDKMAVLIYHWVDRTASISKGTLFGAWRDIKVVLLLWAISYRA